MHLRLRPLQVPIELLLLFVVQDFADLLVGVIAMGPHLGQSLFARRLLSSMIFCVASCVH